MATDKIIIGVDEAGKGAIAGPLVVTAAAYAQETPLPYVEYMTINGPVRLPVTDSKKIDSAAHRKKLAQDLATSALAVSTITVSSVEIDSFLMGVVHPRTIRLTIARVIEQVLVDAPDLTKENFYVYIDGKMETPKDLPCYIEARPHADGSIWQVSAASLIAKNKRDALMQELHKKYPQYDFNINKGYPVKKHKDLLKLHGESPVHRRTFAPVKALRPRPEFIE